MNLKEGFVRANIECNHWDTVEPLRMISLRELSRESHHSTVTYLRCTGVLAIVPQIYVGLADSRALDLGEAEPRKIKASSCFK